MSAAEPDGGFVVITEVSPKPNEEEHSNTGHGAKAYPANKKPLQKFYKGQPKALGVTLLLSGIIQIFFGLAYDVGFALLHNWGMHLFITGVPYWSGLLCIVAGSLSIAAANKPRIGLVRSSLILNTISASASGVSVIVYIVYVGFSAITYMFWQRSCKNSEYPKICEQTHQAYHVSWGILFILLTFSVLQFCVAVSIAAFGCKTICRTAYSEVAVVVYQTTSTNQTPPNVSAALPSYEEIEKF
ncbi:membrane-spanning 4-domains subfamily A member 4D-like [Ambystoma mexicanum]|uniref:membrane-spanning 4-domains subfamily A member 4D-like n=1 Tax=Ambystoma mexicanum TaxID=8296 RepID=UPI0037E74C6D